MGRIRQYRDIPQTVHSHISVTVTSCFRCGETENPLVYVAVQCKLSLNLGVAECLQKWIRLQDHRLDLALRVAAGDLRQITEDDLRRLGLAGARFSATFTALPKSLATTPALCKLDESSIFRPSATNPLPSLFTLLIDPNWHKMRNPRVPEPSRPSLK